MKEMVRFIGIVVTILVSATISVAIILFVIGLPWSVMLVCAWAQPNPPKPQITYGEFPFKLIYEVDGERKEIEDTLICEFDGFNWNGGADKRRKWKEHLASGNKEVVLLKVNSTVNIYYNPGPVSYYMGDYEAYDNFTHDFPNARKSVTIDDKYYSGYPIDAQQLMKLYKIKLISWDYTEPIENSFSD